MLSPRCPVQIRISQPCDRRLRHHFTPKVPRMKAVRISLWCLFRAVIGRVVFGQGWGCIILESALMTFAPNHRHQVYYVHHDKRQIPPALAVFCPMCPWWRLCHSSHSVSAVAMTHCQHDADSHLYTPTTFDPGVIIFGGSVDLHRMEMTPALVWRNARLGCNNGGTTTSTMQKLSKGVISE